MKPLLFISLNDVVFKKTTQSYSSVSNISFFPGIISSLSKIAELPEYDIVLFTNKNKDYYKNAYNVSFDTITAYVKNTFEAENIIVADIVDFTENNTLKIGATTTPQSYIITSQYDAFNYNADLQKICISSEDNNNTDAPLKWLDVYRLIKQPDRTCTVERKTNETSIAITVNLDGTGKTNISTGLHFFDHMLDQIGKHGQMDLTVKVEGDLEVDEHHTIEDTAIVLGEVILKALGNKRGIERYGFCLPMDDCLCQVAIDFGGRAWLVWEAEFMREKVGDMPTEMFIHFFKSFSDASRTNLNIKAEGNNEHHKIEGIFKAFAKTIKMAKKRDLNNNSLPSTKGSL